MTQETVLPFDEAGDGDDDRFRVRRLKPGVREQVDVPSSRLGIRHGMPSRNVVLNEVSPLRTKNRRQRAHRIDDRSARESGRAVDGRVAEPASAAFTQ